MKPSQRKIQDGAQCAHRVNRGGNREKELGKGKEKGAGVDYGNGTQ